MAAVDPDNYIKLFRLDDSQDSTYPENVAIIPAGANVFQTIFHSECRGHEQPTTMDIDDCTLTDEGVNLLVKFRHELEELFRDCGDILGISAVLWEHISRRLFERGFTITAKQCSAKWETLYSEYLEIAQTDDEGRVSKSRHFTALENLYKMRSKYIDSKILEDITEFLSSRADCPSTAGEDIAMKTDEMIDTSSGTNPLKRDMSKREFSNLSNEEDSQMMNEAINAAQKILEENLSNFDDELNEGTEKKEENFLDNSCWRYTTESCKNRSKKSGVQEENSLSLEQKNIANVSREKNLSKTIHDPSTDKEGEHNSRYQIFVQSEKSGLHWDSDATQCFIDLRLYVETSQETKQSISRKYRSIVAFVSQKMALSGFQVSKIDCKKKWDQILRYYNKEIKMMREKGVNKDHLQGVRKYFWQIDKVLKKSGIERSGNNMKHFQWDNQSIKKLIGIRIPMENAFSMFKKYVILWQYVASQMEKHKFLLTFSECSIKWMELCEIYNICLESVKRGAKEEDIHWNFYQDMRQGFEQNTKNTEAIVNYNCSTGLNAVTKDQTNSGMELTKKSTQISAFSASFSGSENIAEIKLDALSQMEDLNDENGTNSQNLDTDVCKSVLEITIQQCNLLEKMINRAESNVKNNPSGTKSSDSSQLNNNTKILTLRDLYSLDIEDNFLIKPAEPETLCIKMPAGALLLDSKDIFEVDKQFDQTALKEVNNITMKTVEATTCNDSFDNPGNLGWTKEATILMIKFKVSRELKFRSLSFRDIDLWKEIATDMQSAGHNVSYESCANRWYQLMAAYKGDPSPSNEGIICPEYWEELKLTELPFTRDTSTFKSARTTGNVNSIDFKEDKFFWTHEAIKNLIRLRFSEEIRPLKKYGSLLTNKMQAAGFPTITHIDVTRKWASLYHSYRESLFRKEIGQAVKWQYFELVDNYMKGLPSGESPLTQHKRPPFTWTHNAVRKLIDLKFLPENSCDTSDRRKLSQLWKRVAYGMVVKGFKVTDTECAIEWNFLVKSYRKTKKELSNGTGAVIGKYFIMMDKALNEFVRLNNGVQNMEEPIDFSSARKKRRLDDSVKNTANNDPDHSLMAKNKKFSKNEKCDKSFQTLSENGMNISCKIIGPLNCSPLGNSSGTKKFAMHNTWGNSRVDSSRVSSFNKEKEVSSILRSELDKSQQESRIFIHKKNFNSADKVEVLDNEEHLDSSKENVASTGEETLNKTSSATSISNREEICSRILCNQKPSKNIPCDYEENNNLQSEYPPKNLHILDSMRNNCTVIQDQSVNSTKNIEGEDMNRSWNEASTHILIDLKIKHKEKFTGWPRPEIEWDKVTDHLARLGHYYTSIECRQKWNSLTATYEEKVSEIESEKMVRAWPYFGKMDSFYNKLGNRYHGFRYILPKKRGCDDDEEHSMPTKKLTVCMKPSENRVTPGILFCNMVNTDKLANIVVDQKKMIE